MKEQKYDLTIGVPSSSRLTEGAETLLKNSGIIYQKTPRAATAYTTIDDIACKLVFTRPSSVVKRVEEGKLDLGIAGQDVVKETRVKVTELRPLNFGLCRLMLILPNPLPFDKNSGGKIDLSFLEGQEVASTYVNITQDYFNQRGITIKPIREEGGLEATLSNGWVKAIVDTVETGNSIAENNLSAVETVLESQAVLVGNIQAIRQKGKEKILSRFLSIIDTALSRNNAPDPERFGESLKFPYLELDYSKLQGYISAVILDRETEQFLMLGYMNQEAYLKTLQLGEVVFWSRTRQELWRKGETSGNRLIVKNIRPTCEKDGLVLFVDPLGPVCHRNTWTCYDDGSMTGLTKEQRFRKLSSLNDGENKSL